MRVYGNGEDTECEGRTNMTWTWNEAVKKYRKEMRGSGWLFFSGANLSGADLSRADLLLANLAEAKLGADKHIYSITGPGSARRMTTYYVETDTVWCGFFVGTLAKFAAQVEKRHANNPQFLHEYRAAIAFFGAMKTMVESGCGGANITGRR